jgi:large subunit ribosomal protein L23
MALFGKKKTTEEKVEKTEVKATKKTVAKKAPKNKEAKKEEVAKVDMSKDTQTKSNYSYRITEKATRLSDKNVYVLNVPRSANKVSLKSDIEKKYKVTVLAVNIVNSPKKEKLYRGKWGYRGGGKKAYITLKAGDSIVL